MTATMPKARKPTDWPALLLELRHRWGTDGKALPQKDAAARVGVTLRSWAGWELGEQLPARPVQKLLLLLHADPDLSPPDLQ